MPFLQVASGEQAGQRIQADADRIAIGRAPDNDIVLADSSVSSHHCCILRAGGTYRLQDLDSTNGTHLNRAAVKESPLKAGDSIHVGSVEVLFREEGDETPTEAVAAQPEEEQVAAPAEEEPVEDGASTQAVARSGGMSPFPSKRRSHGLVIALTLLVTVAVLVAGGWYIKQAGLSGTMVLPAYAVFVIAFGLGFLFMRISGR